MKGSRRRKSERSETREKRERKEKEAKARWRATACENDDWSARYLRARTYSAMLMLPVPPCVLQEMRRERKRGLERASLSSLLPRGRHPPTPPLHVFLLESDDESAWTCLWTHLTHRATSSIPRPVAKTVSRVYDVSSLLHLCPPLIEFAQPFPSRLWG